MVYARIRHCGLSVREQSVQQRSGRAPLRACPPVLSPLADYLLSQSNAATAIEAGAIGADMLRNQILGEIAAFFPDRGHEDAVFGIRVWTTVRT